MKLSEELKGQWKNHNNDEQLNCFIKDIIPKIEHLENQIEKMKHCDNCKHEPRTSIKYPCKTCFDGDDYQSWELFDD